ncbi:hypothetical protein CROQUDRAFT_652877 [Cronartium quercuum f. sp. fusiforme G11]|uniref:Protein kinase domain-containing protein n=1 Tax=Cronartium quercuum f. sp. fusiforme G11 TaxID=708437 RepID=A0A9P6TET9_9BASI|nr:hypothetical protein CROQUDRAFT_652877 [Cronartium quercuum f. sp. fusiforme G11]
MPKPSLVLPNIHPIHPTHSTSSALDSLPSVAESLPPSRPASRRPPLTIASVSNPSIIHNRNASISSHRTHKSNGSLTVSIADGLSTGTTPSSSFGQQPQVSSPDTSRESKYPTTVTCFDPDDEDGGRIHDPRQIISDIQAAMNGAELGSQPMSSRSRSGSSCAIRPIPVRRPRTAEALPRSISTDSRVPSRLGPPPIDGEGPGDEPAVAEGDILEIEFEPEDLEVLNSLGEGAGGEVKKVLHRPSGLYMAKKAIPTSPNPSVHKQILRELAFNREVADGESPWIVKYYGAFLEENDTQIAILLEYCEGGSLDAIYKRIKARQGRIGEKILGKVAESVLAGLTYLHTRKIIHRDIKPSNILVTREGQIKLCDLGVSGELIGSLAGTFMGTSAYMAPERIRGEKYSITSDVWSLGLTLLELALNRFPLSSDGASTMHPFELLQTVVTFEMPSMNTEVAQGIKWTKSLQHFLTTCLDKNPNQRPGPKVLLTQHPWIIKSRTWTPDLVQWLIQVWDWPPRPSHSRESSVEQAKTDED